MKTKSLIMLLILMSAVIKVNGQAHDASQGACRLVKSAAIGDGASCPACKAADKKEQLARDAENKRRNDVIAAKAKADKIASEAARKKQLAEIAEKNKVKEVFVTMPKTPAKKLENSEKEDLDNYKIVNEFKPLDRMSQFSSYNSKILYKGKVIHDSNDFLWIKAAWGKLLFIADYPRKDESCASSEANNSILLDKKGKKINLPGIDRFGYYTKNDDRDDYFDIVVYTGTCTPVKNDRYANGDWHTIKYTFDYKTRNLIESKPSWQHSDCACN